MPKAAVKKDPPYKAKLDRLERLIHPVRQSAREPRPTPSWEEIHRLGGELYAAYPDEPDVLETCIRYIPSVSEPAYKKFMDLMMTPETLDRIPYVINGLEQFYEDAWGRFTEFLESHPELSAQILGLIAYTIEELSARAMKLLGERILQLSHRDLAHFVIGIVGLRNGANVVDFGRNDPNIQAALSLAAGRLLDEKSADCGNKYLLPRFFLFEELRERAADFVLSRPFNWGDCERIIKTVPSRRKATWEFALRHDGVPFKIWLKFVQDLERGSIYADTMRAGSADHERVKFSSADWEDMWSVCERLATKDNEMVLVATGSKQLAVKATEKLAAKKNVQALVSVVGHSPSQDARVNAGKALLASDPTEEMLVSIIGNVPSLRREAAIKLSSMLPAPTR